MKSIQSLKSDLHLHFDGSLVIPAAFELVQSFTQDYEAFSKSMQVKKDCHSLYDYLACFDTPLALLQTKENLYQMALALIQELDKQGLCYAEIRFAPQMHLKKGLSQHEVVEAMCRARKDAMNQTHIHVNYILCMMILGEEKITHDQNEETLHVAHAFKDQGVVAVDLAGAEGMAPMQDFKELFEKAHAMGLRYTIHAGESFGPENIKTAIAFGAERIGHGATAIQDESVMQLLKEKQIPLEVCVTSNVNCEVVSNYEQHPVRRYLDEKIPVLICTDNMTISNTNLDHEYEMLMKYCHVTEEEIGMCQKNSIRYSFADEKIKEKLLNEPLES